MIIVNIVDYLRYLASVVYQSCWILDITMKYPNHPFHGISIINKIDLLNRLKEKVTLDKTEGMQHATGIPPHVEQMKLQKQLLEVCKNTFGRVDSLLDNFGEKIKEVFEERAIENGQVTMHQMKNMFSEFQKSIKEDVTSQIQNLNIPTPQNNDVIDDKVVLSGKTIDHHSKEPNGTLFFWNNRFWEVPKGFDFPTKVNLRMGFEFWLQ